MLHYYVYAYLRKSDLTPYYIGKGKKNRAYATHNVSVPKDKSRIIFLETNLTNTGACAIERRMIKWYGRKNNKTGILRNLTDGGDGGNGGAVKGLPSPFKGKTHTAEKREQISKSKTGKKTSRVYKPLSEETRQKLSKSKKGRPGRKHTPEENKFHSEKAYNNGFHKIVADTIWINNGKLNKRIKPEQLENYPGFIKGRDRSL